MNLNRNPTANDLVRFTVQGTSLKLEVLVSEAVVATLQTTDSTYTAAGY